ncbi:MAG: hypothetical protein E6K39_20810 [Gammaproteobacteria bacterium]|nr:MAG: hypothetical protein E6K39_20810 [Gammaproteobacteria bacterium]
MAVQAAHRAEVGDDGATHRAEVGDDGAAHRAEVGDDGAAHRAEVEDDGAAWRGRGEAEPERISRRDDQQRAAHVRGDHGAVRAAPWRRVFLRESRAALTAALHS